MITQEQLDNWFTYHTPESDEQIQQYKRIRDAGKYFAEVGISNSEPCADQTAAVRKIREAVMTFNQSIACGGK